MRDAADWARHLDRGPFAWRGTLEQFVQAVQADALTWAADEALGSKAESWCPEAKVAASYIADRIRARFYRIGREHNEAPRPAQEGSGG